MDAYFWSDGEISLSLDNKKILDSVPVDMLEEKQQELKAQEAKEK